MGEGTRRNESRDPASAGKSWEVDIDSVAKTELATAIIEYELKSEGLGERFNNAVNSLIARIAERPHAYQRVTRTHFHAVMDIFPYSIIYAASVKRRAILILNIHHAKRHPKNWRRHNPTWRN